MTSEQDQEEDDEPREQDSGRSMKEEGTEERETGESTGSRGREEEEFEEEETAPKGGLFGRLGSSKVAPANQKNARRTLDSTML